jgi:CDP-paratose 2-epimerase
MKVLVTGGAGFIGCNLVDRLVRHGHTITVFDNLSRYGTQTNLAWLRAQHRDKFHFIEGDVRDYDALLAATGGTQLIFHMAAQVAVTTSVTDPRTDFEVNALGTFNLLEAARHAGDNPIVVFASTNKVYGGMEDVAIVEQPTRYAYRDLPLGVPETRPLVMN